MRCRVDRLNLVIGASLLLLAAADAVGQTLPRLIPFTGVVRDAHGLPRSGTAVLSFGIHADSEGGTPLWSEEQTVQLDANGRYSVTLGSTSAQGIPLELFTTATARWLSVRVDRGPELPRVMLVSVPYALKAADADTIAGKPLSAFVLAGDHTGTGPDGLTYVNTALLRPALGGVGAGGASSGTPGYLGVFTNATDLGNSALFQNGSRIGVSTTAPDASFHSVATEAPGAFFDVFNNTLGALPVVYRAARGTPGAPAAVQAGDILGGLAVRGYDGTGFTGGRGQVMFRAAENWTVGANGTYLSFATVPIGGVGPAPERMRIDSTGYVAFGHTSPLFPIDVLSPSSTTLAKFGATRPLFFMGNPARIGFNLYRESFFMRYSSNPAGYITFDEDVLGGFSFATAPTGSPNTLAATHTRMVILQDGKVGIGTTEPTHKLEVAGTVSATGEISTDASISALYGHFSTTGAGFYAVSGQSLAATGTTRGVEGRVASPSGFGGRFYNDSPSGTALRAVVDGTTVMDADATGVHAGPGMTGTPIAYGSFDADGGRTSGSSNITCVWNATYSRYDCTIAGYDYTPASFIAIATAPNSTIPYFCTTSWLSPGTLVVRTFDLSGTSVKRTFHLVVFKP